MANTPVPVFVTAETNNGLVVVREAEAGAGVVPIEVFTDPVDSPNNCVPVRVAVGDERAVPVVVISGALE